MTQSSTTQKKPRILSPLDNFYDIHCSSCQVTLEECKPGTVRELNCILAQIISSLQAINRDMVKDR